MRRKLPRRIPLGVPSIGAPPHRDSPVAIRLSGEPLHNIMPVPTLVEIRFEVSFRIPSAPNIDSEKRVTLSGEIDREIVVLLRHVGSQSHDRRRRLLLISWQVKRGTELNPIAKQ